MMYWYLVYKMYECEVIKILVYKIYECEVIKIQMTTCESELKYIHVVVSVYPFCLVYQIQHDDSL